MFIVKFSKGKRHSAWNSHKEAINQARVLQDAGYIKTKRKTLNGFVEFDETVQCENGHYYV